VTSVGGRGPFVATVIPAPVEDAFGDPVSAPEGPWQVPNCRLAPRGSTEENFQAQRVVTEYDLFAPAGASFPEDATVTVAGLTTKVDGEARTWRSYGPRGQVVPLKRVKG
jgi:hypothetical protein